MASGNQVTRSLGQGKMEPSLFLHLLWAASSGSGFQLALWQCAASIPCLWNVVGGGRSRSSWGWAQLTGLEG